MTAAEFIEVAKAGDEAGVRRALEEDPSLADARVPSGESALIAALYRGHAGVVGIIAGAGATLDTFSAAALGRADALARALHDPSAPRAYSFDGWTALHLAAFFGHADAVALLLDAGAPASAVSTNSLRNTPLHAATAGRHADVALLLIRRGADVRVADAGGHTPLHIAAENGLLDVVRALLDRGADPLAVDGEDKTPLSRAAARNHAAIVDELNRPHR